MSPPEVFLSRRVFGGGDIGPWSAQYSVPIVDSPVPIKYTHHQFDEEHRWILEFTVRNIGLGPAASGWYIEVILGGATNYDIYFEDWGPTDFSLPNLIGTQNMNIIINIPSDDERYDALYSCAWVDLNSHRDEDEYKDPDEIIESDYSNNMAFVNLLWWEPIAETTTELTLELTNPETGSITLINSVLATSVPEGWSVAISSSSIYLTGEEVKPLYINITCPEDPLADATIVIQIEKDGGPWNENFYIFTDENDELEDNG